MSERALKAVLFVIAAYHVLTGAARSEGRGWADTLLIAFVAITAAWLARISERRLAPSHG